MTDSASLPTAPENGETLPVPEEKAAGSRLPMLPPQMDKYVDHFLGWVERCGTHADRLTRYVISRNEEEEMAPENIARGPILFGLTLVTVLFGIFGLWSIVAPIDSAAVSPGKVVLDSNRKTISHLEGGIVKEILVSEGEQVKEGQVLVRMDDTAPKARMELYRGQFIAAQAAQARLIAERDGADKIEWPASLLEMRDSYPDAAANIDSQQRLFESRRDTINGRVDVLQQQIKQHEEEIKGLEKQIASGDKQLDLLKEEIHDVAYLFKSGNAPKSRLLALERGQAQIQGENGERLSMISRAKQSINEAQIQIYNQKTEFLNQVMGELRDTQNKMSDLEEQLRTAEDIVHRVEVVAPIAGQITGLKVHTKGGVVAPGSPLMDIVPSDDKMIIEAKISPQDIDVVHKGLKARVRLTAYKTRRVPPVEGEVETVSGDRFEDPRTGEAYYTARIAIPDSELANLGEHVELTPGMPTEVLIITGSRTFFGYLTSPIRDSFNRSFREQ